MVTGTEGQTSPRALICEVRKNKSQRKLVRWQQRTGALIGTQGRVSDTQLPGFLTNRQGQGAQPQATVSSCLVLLLGASSLFQKTCALTLLTLASWDVRSWVCSPGVRD